MNDLALISPHLGEISWEAGCELHFPSGVPGFERQQRMVPVEIPSQRPLVYLQSADCGEVCFLTLPVLTVSSGFTIHLSEDDRALLQFDELMPWNDCPLRLGIDMLCLALLVPFGRTVQTNLDAPIIINLHNRRGVQAVARTPAAGSYRLSQYGGWEAVC